MGKKKEILAKDQMISFLFKEVADNYWRPLYRYLKSKPDLIETFTGFLFDFDKVVFYLGKTHLAIEYFGPMNLIELDREREAEIQLFDYSLDTENFFDQIVGFKYDGTVGGIRMPLPSYSDEWILPTNKGFKKLIELKWNFGAQNSIIGINTSGFEAPNDEFCRIVNGLFFDADENGLKTRHIKWIDFLPLTMDDSNPEYDVFGINLGPLRSLIQHDAHYEYPSPKGDFKYSKLPQINRFIELIGNSQTSEVQITKFLELPENKFILTMGFLAKEIYPQVKCEWQSEKRESIQPDFFIERPNGYADIVEFKLPHLKSDSVVGHINRKTFSAEINSYISQTRSYRTYFEDPNNRAWIENKYDIKVYYPRRILIMGRRWDFSSDEWKAILNDYTDIEIMTYEDLIDGVVAQFYM